MVERRIVGKEEVGTQCKILQGKVGEWSMENIMAIDLDLRVIDILDRRMSLTYLKFSRLTHL